jgi:hypothetical protein
MSKFPLALLNDTIFRWLQLSKTYRRGVETQSLKLSDDTVLTMITLLPGK